MGWKGCGVEAREDGWEPVAAGMARLEDDPRVEGTSGRCDLHLRVISDLAMITSPGHLLDIPSPTCSARCHTPFYIPVGSDGCSKNQIVHHLSEQDLGLGGPVSDA
jgi:hypothetical protein